MRYAAVSLALVDNLIAALKEKGVLNDADREQIITGALAGLHNSPNVDIQGAAALMKELYRRP